jgi:hypothetical protein
MSGVISIPNTPESSDIEDGASVCVHAATMLIPEAKLNVVHIEHTHSNARSGQPFFVEVSVRVTTPIERFVMVVVLDGSKDKTTVFPMDIDPLLVHAPHSTVADLKTAVAVRLSAAAHTFLVHRGVRVAAHDLHARPRAGTSPFGSLPDPQWSIPLLEDMARTLTLAHVVVVADAAVDASASARLCEVTLLEAFAGRHGAGFSTVFVPVAPTKNATVLVKQVDTVLQTIGAFSPEQSVWNPILYTKTKGARIDSVTDSAAVDFAPPVYLPGGGLQFGAACAMPIDGVVRLILALVPTLRDETSDVSSLSMRVAYATHTGQMQEDTVALLTPVDDEQPLRLVHSLHSEQLQLVLLNLVDKVLEKSLDTECDDHPLAHQYLAETGRVMKTSAIEDASARLAKWTGVLQLTHHSPVHTVAADVLARLSTRVV